MAAKKGIVDTVKDNVAGFFGSDDKTPAKRAPAKKVASKKAAKKTRQEGEALKPIAHGRRLPLR